ncbi:MAG: ester cyclase [Parvularculaceae bacterium]|nr:ester cyclase [Parvularculaceae bacterium]
MIRLALAASILLLALAPLRAEGRCASKTPASNAATARIVFDEILSKGLIEENERIYHPDFVARGLRRDVGRAEDRAAAAGWRQMAPDLKMTPLRVVADCNLVAVHWEGTGTNTGEGNGFPATGRSIRVWGMTFFRFEDGKIREEWTSFDRYEFLSQLGLIGE